MLRSLVQLRDIRAKKHETAYTSRHKFMFCRRREQEHRALIKMMRDGVFANPLMNALRYDYKRYRERRFWLPWQIKREFGIDSTRELSPFMFRYLSNVADSDLELRNYKISWNWTIKWMMHESWDFDIVKRQSYGMGTTPHHCDHASRSYSDVRA